MATKATLWSKANIEQTSAIHRYILKSVQWFDSDKGLFWKPPLKSQVSSVVPVWEQTAYKRQNQWLWDQLVSVHCSQDLIRLILRPTKKGYYNDIPVIGEEGNGVLALWVLMMHFRKCNEAYCLSLIDCLEKSESLFRSPKASIASSVKQVSTVLKECIDLGIQVPWKNTGRPVAAILRSKGYATYLFEFRHGGVDPQDSAPHFMQMLDAIESSTPDVEEVMSKKSGQRPWRAHEAQVFELVEDESDPTNPYKIESSPNPEAYPSEQEHMWANEAQEIENEVWGEEHSWEYEWGEGGEWHEYPSPEIYAYDASFTKGKGKKGKSGKGNKGSKGGKDSI